MIFKNFVFLTFSFITITIYSYKMLKHNMCSKQFHFFFLLHLCFSSFCKCLSWLLPICITMTLIVHNPCTSWTIYRCLFSYSFSFTPQAPLEWPNSLTDFPLLIYNIKQYIYILGFESIILFLFSKKASICWYS